MNGKLLAQICNPVIPGIIGCGGAHQGGIAAGKLISTVISGGFMVAFLTAFLFVMTGGFYWITSGGDKNNLEHARNKITHAIIGLIVVASTWAIAVIVGKFVGLDIGHLPIPSVTNP